MVSYHAIYSQLLLPSHGLRQHRLSGHLLYDVRSVRSVCLLTLLRTQVIVRDVQKRVPFRQKGAPE